MTAVDDQPELRYTNNDGLGAIHFAVINDKIDILKILLDSDKTLLCMEVEDKGQSIIHLAAERQNMAIVRYLLSNPVFFKLFNENEVAADAPHKSFESQDSNE